MKKMINPLDYANHICNAMKRGILLTTRKGQQVNTMSIGWGFLGIDWGRPVFVALVRESRYTRQLLEENDEFTVNIPMEDSTVQIIRICGTKSGRDTDKITELGLTLEDPLEISVPGIRELPLTLECRVIYRQKQDLSAIPKEIVKHHYPQDVDGSNPGSNRDVHAIYYGEIVSAYLITE